MAEKLPSIGDRAARKGFFGRGVTQVYLRNTGAYFEMEFWGED